MIEARRYHRRPVDLRATVTIDGATPLPCRVDNLSVGGARVVLPALPHGSRVALAFQVPADGAPGEDLDVFATVMWTEQQSVGVRFEGLRARQTWALCRFLDSLVPAGRPDADAVRDRP